MMKSVPTSHKQSLSAKWLVTATVFLVSTLLAFQPALANTPCSGRKGGIDRSQGDTFICRDGSVSASKNSCQATMRAVGLLGTEAEEMHPSLTAECSCRGGNYCTGPRGGRYCMTDTGKKSYLRR